MKKLLLSFTLVLGAIATVNAQCTPDPQYTDPGIYPDSATGLTPQCADQPYYQLITNVVPADTTITVPIIGSMTLVFDSVVISSWTGLPNGFSYACYDAQNTISPVDGCAFEGNTTGCVEITGNPTLADVGSYQQIINVDAYLTPNPLGNPQSQTVDYYYIQILDCSQGGLSAITNSKFYVYPNPAKDMITLNGINGLAVENVQVISMEGKVMATYTDVTGGDLDMDINNLSEGMYFIHINHDGQTSVVKFIKE